MFRRIKVTGDSMSPTLEDGDIVITIKPRSIRPGLIYVINHSDLGRVIKRLGAKTGQRYTLMGDNPISTPSAVMGTIEPTRITGRAILVFGKSGIRKL